MQRNDDERLGFHLPSVIVLPLESIPVEKNGCYMQRTTTTTPSHRVYRKPHDNEECEITPQHVHTHDEGVNLHNGRSRCADVDENSGDHQHTKKQRRRVSLLHTQDGHIQHAYVFGHIYRLIYRHTYLYSTHTGRHPNKRLHGAL